MDSATLAAAIYKTVAYFDIFEYPLTLHELWRWLYLPAGQATRLSDLLELLESGALAGQVECQDGLYFLAGRQTILERRFERYQLAEKKLAIARRAARVLRWLPFVELAAVCNKLGYANTPAEGDIDFFVVARAGRLWTARLLVTLMVSALGVRIGKEKVADRVCLSFFVTDTHMDLSDIALTPDDPYLRYWVATLLPLYDRRPRRASSAFAHYRGLLEANRNMLAPLPNFFPSLPPRRRGVEDSWLSRWVSGQLEFWLAGRLGTMLERLVRLAQLWRRHSHDRRWGPAESTMVLSDSMLKFHEHDRRALYRDAWEQKFADSV